MNYSKVSDKRTVYAYLISKNILPVRSYLGPVRLIIFEFETKVELEVIQKGEKNHTCTLIEELIRPERLFFLEILSPSTVIKDCTFIRDIKILCCDAFISFL